MIPSWRQAFPFPIKIDCIVDLRDKALKENQIFEMGQDGTGWDRVGQGGTGWDRMGQGGTGWDWVGLGSGPSQSLSPAKHPE